MNLYLLLGLCAACVVMMIIERTGVRTTLTLNFKGDIKRESRWLAQYGQFVCAIVAGILVWQLDPNGRERVITLAVGYGIVSIVCTIMKRSIGRVRPNRENAGKFLGPTFKHANFRESFPSSHSACAVTMSVVLAHYYPAAASTFWTLALLCAGLRYVLDAHWLSDVLGGIALGYGVAYLAMQIHLPV
jgi:undecaprenyl-diphosphatase